MKYEKGLHIAVLAGLLILAVSVAVMAAQQVTMTTFYPAPFGEYRYFEGITGQIRGNTAADFDFVVGQRSTAAGDPIVQIANMEVVGDLTVGRTAADNFGISLNGTTIHSWSETGPASTTVRMGVGTLDDQGTIPLPDGGGAGYVAPNTSFWPDGSAVTNSQCSWTVTPQRQLFNDGAATGNVNLYAFTDDNASDNVVGARGRQLSIFAFNEDGITITGGRGAASTRKADYTITCVKDAVVQQGSAPICNNDTFCVSPETVQNCPGDCHCGNGTCQSALGETAANCPADCQSSDGGSTQQSCVSEDSLLTVLGKGRIPVKDIQAGESVWTYDFQAKEGKFSKVSAVWNEVRSRLYVIQTPSRILKVTADHRVPTPLGDLSGKFVQVGTPLYIWKEGRLQEEKVVSVSVEKGKFTVYNLTLPDTHLYFSDGVLVHNMKCQCCGGNC